MKPPHPFAATAGFTLIEVMIAVAILSIGLLSLANLQIAMIRGNAFSQRMTTAASIAEAKLEQLKNTPLAQIHAEPPTAVTASNRTFTRHVMVAAGPQPNTVSASVIVTWVNGAKTHTLPLTTIMGK
jgi:type IV pilus modification protein PilV